MLPERRPPARRLEITNTGICETCGKYFSNEALTQEITKEATIIEAKGHGETELINRKDATCTIEGYSGDKICKDCGEVLERERTFQNLRITIKKAYVRSAARLIRIIKPTDLTEPSNPGNSADPSDSANSADSVEKNGNADKNSDNPQTGNDYNLILWLILLLASGTTVVIVTAYGFRKRRE